MPQKKICFVIQQFTEPYNGRYDRIYKPAIEAAGFVAYRVDEDKGASVITQKIEEEIRNAHICFADISENNPNVWYEVGFAFACGKQTVMVCNKERREMNKLPFDIKVKRVIPYAAVDNHKHACSGFKQEITEEIQAKAANVAPVSAPAEKTGVFQTPIHDDELYVIKCILGASGGYVQPQCLRDQLSYKFCNNMQGNLAIDGLLVRDIAKFSTYDGSFYLTNKGKEWCAQNRALLEKKE